MKKQLLFIFCSGIAMSLYPAKVEIKNNTDQLVLAQINKQRRAKTFYSIRQEEYRYLYGAGSVVTMGIPPVIVEPVAAIRRAVGIPNFVPIKPNSSAQLATTVFKGGLAGGAYGETIPGKGRPITKITFARVKGFKTYTGYYKDLKEQLKLLAEKYGNIGISKLESGYPAYYASYYDALSGAKKKRVYFGPKGKDAASIAIPIIEEFTYFFRREDRIKRFEKDAVVELRKWGKVKRVR